MSRLSRFEDYRFIGAKDTMRVYDCDDPEQFAALEQRIDEEDMINRKLVLAFAPDTLEEARNRGFTPTTSPKREATLREASP